MMSWNKNAFGYTMWLIFTTAVGYALSGSAMMFCVQAGAERYWGILFTALFLAGAGGIVFFLHRGAAKLSGFAAENRRILLAAEALWVAALFALGLVLRMQSIGAASQTSEYYEAAKVVEEQHIPQILHGATYYYVQFLHIALKLLGNRMMVGIWLQVICQLAAFLVLYFVVRKLAGAVSALVSLGFCMCAPYLVQKAVVLSPEMLYFDLFMAAVALIGWLVLKVQTKKGYFFAGFLAALCLYIDIAGALLLIYALSLVFCGRCEGAGKKATAFLGCLGGAAVGLFTGIFLDASMSGKTVWKVAQAFWRLYQPEGFQWMEQSLPGSEIELLLLFGCMAFGIFSFWRHGAKERISVGSFAVCAIVAAECFGVFTKWMPGGFYFYLLCVLLAGVSLGQCFTEKPFWGETLPIQGEALKEAVQEPVKEEKAEEALYEKSRQDFSEEDRKAYKALDEALEETGFFDEEEEDAFEEVFGGERETVSEPQEEIVEETGFLDEEDQAETFDAREPEQPKEDMGAAGPEKKTVKYIENPLPLPKKHVKRVMDYTLQTGSAEDDFDYAVEEDDDFDI